MKLKTALDCILDSLAAMPNVGGIHQAELNTSPNTPGANTVTFFCFCRKLSKIARATPNANRDKTRRLSDTVGTSYDFLKGAL